MKTSKYLSAWACGIFLAATALNASAQEKWPSRNISYVVPFAAGGTTDVLGRLIASKLGPALGTVVVVENRPGAGGNIGSDFVAKAAPDGHTLVGGTISSHSINTSLYSKMPYDPVKHFQPVTLIGTLPNVLVVNANSPHRSVQDVIAAAKAKPESVNYGSSGNGTSQHLSGALFQSITGTKMVHVPYKGSAPAMQALMGGEVDLVFENILAAVPLIQSGKIRALGVTSAKRASQLPDTPALAEAGVPGYEIVSWQAVFAPAGTPQPVVQRLSTEIGKIIQDPEIKARLSALGVEPSGAGPAELGSFQKSEVAKWAQLIKSANIKTE
ncbi:tripartite tricarboxylate transporter substrate binding protein [Noviherbaspirillum sp. CPCC 100848]|uniref:Tripartite tricarboxylate transporter substrate binding protein n=1 Tax=Noviherbaspirillum album TaxID=3080276 RepID=A0ABU6J8B1_9BURK|nr:tripartite tricarboxylate transporter substrate binding protein [Noviherbaspirillum sp. CPCC 100848]MEC4719874.1 tripartite tricarboxylate transporter substrate binding protein [Noviherbaspirillum sp. CPCC 100848]